MVQFASQFQLCNANCLQFILVLVTVCVVSPRFDVEVGRLVLSLCAGVRSLCQLSTCVYCLDDIILEFRMKLLF